MGKKVNYLGCMILYGAGKDIHNQHPEIPIEGIFHAEYIKKIGHIYADGFRDWLNKTVHERIDDVPVAELERLGKKERNDLKHFDALFDKWVTTYNETVDLISQAMHNISKRWNPEAFNRSYIVFTDFMNNVTEILEYGEKTYNISYHWAKVQAAHKTHLDLSGYKHVLKGTKRYHYKIGYVTHAEYDAERERNAKLQKDKREEHKKMDHIKLKRWKKVILKQVLNERSGTINQLFIDILDFFGGIGSGLFNAAEDFGDFLFDESDEGLVGMVLALLECDEFDPFDFDTFDKYESGCAAFGYIPPDLPRFPPVLDTIDWPLNGPNGPVSQPDYESCKSLNFEDGFDNIIYMLLTTFPDVFDFLHNDPSIVISIFRSIPFFGTIITRFDGVDIGAKTDFCNILTILNIAFLLAGIILFLIVFNTFGVLLFNIIFDLLVNVIFFQIGLLNARLQGIERSDVATKERKIQNDRLDAVEQAINAARGGGGGGFPGRRVQPTAPPPEPLPKKTPEPVLPRRRRRTSLIPRPGDIPPPPPTSWAIGSDIPDDMHLDMLTDEDIGKHQPESYLSPSVTIVASKNAMRSGWDWLQTFRRREVSTGTGYDPVNNIDNKSKKDE